MAQSELKDPKITVEIVDLDKLVPRDVNPRFITDGNKKRLTKSLEEFGQIVNLIVNKDYVILSGNQRHEIMTELGWKQCSVMVVDMRADYEDGLNIIMNSKRARGYFLTEAYKRIVLSNRDDFQSLKFESELFVIKPVDDGVQLSSEPDVNFLEPDELEKRDGQGNAGALEGGALIRIRDISFRMTLKDYKDLEHRCLVKGINPVTVMIKALDEEV